MKKIITTAILATSTLIGQESGLVDNSVYFFVTIDYLVPGTRTIDGQVNPKFMEKTIIKTLIPGPYKPVKNFAPWQLNISKEEAISLGVPEALISKLENQQQNYQNEYGEPYGSLGFTKGYTGEWVGKPRRTFGTIGSRNTPMASEPIGGIRYARFFRDRLQNNGWTCTWHIEDSEVNSTIFSGHQSKILNSGIDLAFYAGHGSPNGPAYPGCNPSEYYWGEKKGKERGLRWMITQSCNWFPAPSNRTMSSETVINYNGPWSKAMEYGQGSMHAIFGYASVAWLWPSATWDYNIPGFHVSDTDCSPIAFLNNIISDAGTNGNAWIMGSHQQRKVMRKIRDDFSWIFPPSYLINLDFLKDDLGQAPSVLSVSNWFGDYYNESILYPYPDPVDLDDPSPTLKLHTLVVGEPNF